MQMTQGTCTFEMGSVLLACPSQRLATRYFFARVHLLSLSFETCLWVKRDDQNGSSLAILHLAGMPGQKKMRPSCEGYRCRTVSISMLNCSCDLTQYIQAGLRMTFIA